MTREQTSLLLIHLRMSIALWLFMGCTLEPIPCNAQALVRKDKQIAEVEPNFDTKAEVLIAIDTTGNLRAYLRPSESTTLMNGVEFLFQDEIAAVLDLTNNQLRRLKALDQQRETDQSVVLAQEIAKGKPSPQSVNKAVQELNSETMKQALAELTSSQRNELDTLFKRQKLTILGWPQLLKLLAKERDFSLREEQIKQYEAILKHQLDLVRQGSTEVLKEYLTDVNEVFRVKDKNHEAIDLPGSLPIEILYAQLCFGDNNQAEEVEHSFLPFETAFRVSPTGKVVTERYTGTGFSGAIQCLANSAAEGGLHPDQLDEYFNELRNPDTKYGKIIKQFGQQVETLQLEMTNGKLSIDAAGKKIRQLSNEKDQALFHELESRLLPGQRTRLDLLLAQSELRNLGIDWALSKGRFGKLMQVTTVQREQLAKLKVKYRDLLGKKCREMALQTENELRKVFDQQQQEFLKDRLGAFDTKANELCACPTIMLIERKR